MKEELALVQRIGAALFAAALIGAASGVARAQQRPIVHRVLQTQTLASIAERELRDLEIAGSMPTANADLDMWSDDGPATGTCVGARQQIGS